MWVGEVWERRWDWEEEEGWEGEGLGGGESGDEVLVVEYMAAAETGKTQSPRESQRVEVKISSKTFTNTISTQ